MKNIIFIASILIILFKTGNVLSNTSIFNVNNIQISKEFSQNKEKLVNQAFKKAFDELSYRLLLKEDYQKVTNLDLSEIKKLISYYQISNLNLQKEKEKKINVNVFFDKDKMYNFFYKRNILYSDSINTEVIIFPLLKERDQYFFYTKNYFYKVWNSTSSELMQFILPAENIEEIQKINSYKDNILRLDIFDFFKEYANENVVFANIEINENIAKIYLKSRIEGQKINKNLLVEKKINSSQKDFYDLIILEVNFIIKDLVKSQNLIDVRTPSFLNVKIQLDDKKNLIEFNNRIKKIDLVENFYVQQLNKDFVLIKIKYFGKIKKIIKKFQDQNINLKILNGEWQLKII